MEILELVVILVLLVLFSNLLSRVFHKISLPLIQVILGGLLGVSAYFINPIHVPDFEPEVFFALFIAPLLFNDAKNTSRQELKKLGREILSFAVPLVFLTVLIAGYVLHIFAPDFSLAMCFAVAASLAPTDAVSVAALKSRVHLPKRVQGVLEGESLVNDASGVVSFRFAISAAVAGTFSLADASLEFLKVALGGIILGLIITLLKLAIMSWVRHKGVENAVQITLFEIITPFFVFIICEHFEFSGVLGVVTSGLMHIYNSKKLNPEAARLKMLSNSTWTMLTFTMNGIVFLLLGAELPRILLEAVDEGPRIIISVILLSLLLVAVIYTIRFIWAFIIIGGDELEEKDMLDDKPVRISRLRSAILSTLSGAKGAVTLATILSIPVIGSSAFGVESIPYLGRDLLISIASMAILITLLVANYILPLFSIEVKHKNNDNINIYRDIISHVIRELNFQKNDDNSRATSLVIREYMIRLQKLQHELTDTRTKSSNLQKQVLEWEKESLIEQVEKGNVDKTYAYTYILRINSTLIHSCDDKQIKHELRKEDRKLLREIRDENDGKRGTLNNSKFERGRRKLQILAEGVSGRASRRGRGKERIEAAVRKRILIRLNMVNIQTLVAKYVIKQLDGNKKDYPEDIWKVMHDEYQLKVKACENYAADTGDAARRANHIGESPEVNDDFFEIAEVGFQLERDEIQNAVDDGKLSADAARKFRQDVDMMEFGLRGS